jgi:hypothetical protein
MNFLNDLNVLNLHRAFLHSPFDVSL